MAAHGLDISSTLESALQLRFHLQINVMDYKGFLADILNLPYIL